jgi:hypothetical protein
MPVEQKPVASATAKKGILSRLLGKLGIYTKEK